MVAIANDCVCVCVCVHRERVRSFEVIESIKHLTIKKWCLKLMMSLSRRRRIGSAILLQRQRMQHSISFISFHDF